MKGATKLVIGLLGGSGLFTLIDETALIDYFDERGIYRFNGVNYPNRAAWLTAIGGSVASDAVTVTPKLVGSPVYTGNFAAGVDGWVEGSGFEANGELTQAGGALVLTTISAADYRISKQLALTANRHYRVQAHQVSRTAGNSQVGGGTVANLSSGNTAMTAFATAGAETQNVYAQSDAAGAFYASLFKGSTAGVLTVDAVVVTEVEPYIGWEPNQLAFDIDVTMPAAFSGTQVIAQWSGSDDDSRIRLSVDASGVLSLSVLAYSTAAQAAITLGTVAVNSRHRIRASLAANAVYVVMDDDPMLSDLGVIVPSASLFFIKRAAVAGQTFNGIVHRLRIWPNALADQNALLSPQKSFRIFGDSTAVGTGASVSATSWHALLVAAYTPDRTRTVDAAGGENTTQMLARVADDTDVYKTWTTIFMDRPNSGETVGTWIANMKAAVGYLTTDRWLVVPPVLNSPGGQPDPEAATVLGIQEELLDDAFFAGHTFSAAEQLAYATELNDDDVRVVTGDDFTHFNDAGHLIQETHIKAWLDAKGW